MSVTIDAEVRLLHPDWCDTGFRPPNEAKVRSMIYDHPLTATALPKASLESLNEEMERTGIDRCVIRGLFWNDPEMCRRQNEYLSAVAGQAPDRFTPMAVLPSPMLQDPRSAVRALHDELGFKMFEMIPSWQGYKLDDLVAAPALEEAERLGMVVGAEVDHMIRDPDKVDTAHSALVVMRRHPELRFLLAHLGGLLCLYGHNPDVGPALRNALFVTSVPKTPQWISYAVQAVGPGSVAFGTDYPFNITSTQDDLRKAIEALQLNPEDEASIMGGNVVGILDGRNE